MAAVEPEIGGNPLGPYCRKLGLSDMRFKHFNRAEVPG